VHGTERDALLLHGSARLGLDAIFLADDLGPPFRDAFRRLRAVIARF